MRWNDQRRSRYQFDATTVTVAWFNWVERWTIKLERKCAEVKLSQNIHSMADKAQGVYIDSKLNEEQETSH